MRHPLALLASTLLATALAVGAAPASQSAADDAKIATLILQLGDASFQKREAATRQLVEIGEPARRRLRELLKQPPEAEVRRRAEDILKQLDEAAAKNQEVHVVGLYEPGFSHIDTILPRGVDWPRFCTKLAEQEAKTALSPAKHLWDLLPPNVHDLIKDEKRIEKAIQLRSGEDHQVLHNIRSALNRVLDQSDFYDEKTFRSVQLSEDVRELLKRRDRLSPLETRYLNRLLLEAAFPKEVGRLAPAGAFPERVVVRVGATAKPVVLVLTAYHSVRWQVEPEKGANVVKLIVSGYEAQEVADTDIPIENYSGPRGNMAEPRFFAFTKSAEGDRERHYEQLEGHIRALTGKEITRFQGQYRYDGRPFMVPAPPAIQPAPKNTRLHVVGVYDAGGRWLLGLHGADVKGWSGLGRKLRSARDDPRLSVARRVWERLPAEARQGFEDEELLERLDSQSGPSLVRASLQPPDPMKRHHMAMGLLTVLQASDFYDPDSFQGMKFSPEIQRLLDRRTELSAMEARWLNRLLLQATFPEELAARGQPGAVPGTVKIEVRASGSPIILVLTAYDSVRWLVEADKGAQLLCVIVAGYHAQEVAGVDVPVTHCTHDFGDRTDGGLGYFYAFDKDAERYPAMIAKLKQLTGLDVTSFQGRQHSDGTPFVVGASKR